MSSSGPGEQGGPHRLTRRSLLGGIAIGGAGVVAGAVGAQVAAGSVDACDDPPVGAVPTLGAVPTPGAIPTLGAAVEPFHGAHQAGIATALQAHATLVALDLRDGVDRSALIRLMRLLTDDAARLMAGRPALADPEPELADVPARLTITVGFGPGLLAAAGRADRAPAWLGPLPGFSIDRLSPRWSHGDLLLQVAAEDPVTISHAVRVLLGDTGPFATVRWVQRGFHRPVGTAPVGITGRNLMGQVDGTENPVPGTEDFDRVVWITDGPEWLHGGTAVLVRRIAMDLGTWGVLGVGAKEQAIGRRLADGAPLTGGTERTAPDFEAVDDNGFLVIPPTAHVRLAHATSPVERFLRRPYNYDDGVDAQGRADAGLLFVAMMADPIAQYVPVQRRLEQADVLNIWTTPIGSAVFAVPPGCAPGEHLGQQLLA